MKIVRSDLAGLDFLQTVSYRVEIPNRIRKPKNEHPTNNAAEKHERRV